MDLAQRKFLNEYTISSMADELRSMIDRQIINEGYLIIVPGEQGEDNFAGAADYSETYNEFNIEPLDNLAPLTVKVLLDSFEEALDDAPVYVYSIHGGKMVQASSIGVKTDDIIIRIY